MFKFIIEGNKYTSKKDNKENVVKLFNILLEMYNGKLYEVYFDNNRILSGIMSPDDINTILDFCKEV